MENLQKLSLNGVSTASGTLNLTKANRLETLDLRGTKYGQVRMPSSPQLTVARFGSEMSALAISDMPQLKTLTLEGYSKMTSLSVRRCPLCDTKTLGQGCADNVLSEREREVLVQVANGLSNKEIADALCLSTHTVITHRKNIAAKLNIHSTAGLTIYAIANGLVEI